MCAMTHSNVCHDFSHIFHDSCVCARWLIHMYDMTHSHVGHDFSHICHDFSHICQGSITCAPWLIHMWAVIHLQVVYKEQAGKRFEPVEEVTIELEDQYMGGYMTYIHRLYTYIHIYIHTWICIRIHAFPELIEEVTIELEDHYMGTCIHTHTHTHTHTHVWYTYT